MIGLKGKVKSLKKKIIELDGSVKQLVAGH